MSSHARAHELPGSSYSSRLLTVGAVHDSATRDSHGWLLPCLSGCAPRCGHQRGDEAGRKVAAGHDARALVRQLSSARTSMERLHARDQRVLTDVKRCLRLDVRGPLQQSLPGREGGAHLEAGGTSL